MDTVFLENWIEQLKNTSVFTDFHDDFTTVRKIGIGSFSTVFLVNCNQTRKDYVAKIVNLSELSERSRQSLLNEILILRKIEHSSAMKLYQVYEDNEEIIFIVEYIPGGDLYNALQGSPHPSESLVKGFATNILKVLQYLHTEEIMHRDIKPENILLVEQGNIANCKLADFGFACVLAETNRLTCGSPGYVAPEILNKREYNEKIDIFGLGVILYIMFTGNSPFSGRNIREVLVKNKACSINFDRDHWGKISKQGQQFVKKLTNLDPKFRPSATVALNDPWFTEAPEYLASHTFAAALARHAGISRIRTDHFSKETKDLLAQEAPRESAQLSDHIKRYFEKQKTTQ